MLHFHPHDYFVTTNLLECIPPLVPRACQQTYDLFASVLPGGLETSFHASQSPGVTCHRTDETDEASTFIFTLF